VRPPAHPAGRRAQRSRLTAVDILAASGLPAVLEQLAARVTSRARLRRRDAARVATELVNHFIDGLTAGRTAEDLESSFGNLDVTARLIRRALRRQRPRWWRFTRRSIALSIALFLAVTLFYIAWGVRVFTARPTIAVDYIATLNEAALAIPSEDCAWTWYAQTGYTTRGFPVTRLNRLPRPGEPGWEQFEAHLALCGDAIGLCHRGASCDAYGRLLSGNSLYWVLLNDLGTMRGLSTPMQLHAWQAADRGDAEATLADITTMLRMGEHVAEPPFLICQLVRLSIWQRAIDTANELLYRHPDLWSDDQLVTLAHALERMGGASGISIDLSVERLVFDDLVQRCYTDDGDGGGILTAAGARELSDMAGSFPVDLNRGSWLRHLAVPAASLVVADRGKMTRKYNRVMDAYERDLRRPMWEPGHGNPEADALESSDIAQLRYAPIANLIPASGRAWIKAELLRQDRDALLVVIAAHRFLHREGRWPDAADELVPIYLPCLPHDRHDGSRLKYMLRDGQPVVYGVGPDLDDDGGDWPRYRAGRPDPDAARRGTYPSDALSKAPDGDLVHFPPYVEPLRSLADEE
jgi:hypothetical protein